MSRWPEVVIFDCDGVLVDSETIALARTRAALARLGLALGEAEVRERFLGISAQSLQEIVERALGAPLPTDFQSELAREILVDFERELKGVEGIGEAIAKLPTLVQHGRADDAIAMPRARKSVEMLRELGAPVTFREYDCRHEICADGIRDLSAFLAEKVADRSAT